MENNGESVLGVLKKISAFKGDYLSGLLSSIFTLKEMTFFKGICAIENQIKILKRSIHK